MSSDSMKWNSLLDKMRVRDLLENSKSLKVSGESRSEYERDRDRTVYSSPTRRLIGKTQVFPLDPNDLVRTRMIHSLEVSTVAEGLASQVVRDVISKREPKLMDEQLRAISKISETCGLLHDVGNPPFGHAGELAIASWFQRKLESDKGIPKNKCFYSLLGGSASQKAQDFLRFEGNAQTLRLITNTHLLAHDHGLNLTCATVAAARKYLAPSVNAHEGSTYHELTKPGYFESEAKIFREVSRQTGTQGRRHPITFLVEAADDIVYCVVDIEDGIKKRILTWKHVEEWLRKQCGDSGVFKEALSQTERHLKNGVSSGWNRDDEYAQAFRVNAISAMVRAAVETYRERYNEIMCGEYHTELVCDTKCGATPVVKACKELLRSTVFRVNDVLRLEVRGRKVIHDLMDLFWEGAQGYEPSQPTTTKTYAGKLYLLISENYRRVFERRIIAQKENPTYCRLQLVTDYIAGMTDNYACRLHRDLKNG